MVVVVGFFVEVGLVFVVVVELVVVDWFAGVAVVLVVVLVVVPIFVDLSNSERQNSINVIIHGMEDNSLIYMIIIYRCLGAVRLQETSL